MPPGVQHYTLFQTGKETTAGTAVAATRQWYPDGTGIINIDPNLALHRGNRGTKTHLAHASTKGYTIGLTYRSENDIGVAYDELPIILNQAGGGTAGSGASANKTWTFNPTQTSADTVLSHTIEVGDDVQFWEFEYGQVSQFTLSAARDGMTQLEADWFARQPTKTTKTSVTANTAVRIPGNLWRVRFATAQSGLSGASDQSNFLLDWSAQYTTGLVPRFYQDGTAYFGQSVQAVPLSAMLTLHVESTSTAVSQFYDKHIAQTVDFIQLAATGPSLGTATYSAQLQYAVLYTGVKPIASESDGVNIYEITAETVYDSTWTNSMGGTVVCSIASIP